MVGSVLTAQESRILIRQNVGGESAQAGSSLSMGTSLQQWDYEKAGNISGRKAITLNVVDREIKE